MDTLSSGLSNHLSSIYFADANTGYTIGSEVNNTKNHKWWNRTGSPQVSGTLNGLYSIYFTDANTGYVVGSEGIILKTTNGGTNWDTLSSGTSWDLTSVYFTDANTGYVVGL